MPEASRPRWQPRSQLLPSWIPPSVDANDPDNFLFFYGHNPSKGPKAVFSNFFDERYGFHVKDLVKVGPSAALDGQGQPEPVLLHWDTGHTSGNGRTEKDLQANVVRKSYLGAGKPIRFWCSEQEMMLEKALCFSDKQRARLILAEQHDPSWVKQHGRNVHNYDNEVWAARRLQLVTNALRRKFTDRDDLRHILLATGNKVLVEAAWSDNVWGIGLSEWKGNYEGVLEWDEVSQKATFSVPPWKWKGQNLLGRALMEVRRELQAARLS